MTEEKIIKKQMEEIYGQMSPDEIPWNMETPPNLLKDLINQGIIKPCRTLDLGCGTGNYALYLASNGFEVTGVDISSSAINIAKSSALSKGLKCNFFVANVLKSLGEITGKFDFAYDWEVLHHIFPNQRREYVKNVRGLLNPGGHYLSVCFSESDLGFKGLGKYRQTRLGTVLYFSSEEELKELFEMFFRIEEFKTVTVAGKYKTHKAIYALLSVP
jgi:2-polyprenyl-3-methyl-5-hydroxy-6-metoxy-1,4-benzoquinol methylase